MPSGRNIPVTGQDLFFKSHVTKKKPNGGGGERKEHTLPGLSKHGANTIVLVKQAVKLDIIPAAF